MSDKITLDRETFKALAADTRVEILKRIAKHKLTLTDLAEEMNMSPSTIKAVSYTHLTLPTIYSV